jgi:hypothetical protein
MNKEKDLFETTKLIHENIDKVSDKHNKIKKINSDDLLREEISSFIVSQMESIRDQDSFRNVIINALKEKVLVNDLKVSDLISLYRTISSEKSDNTQTLLDIFKPQSNIPSPLLNPKNPNDNQDSISKYLEEADPEFLQGIFLLMKKLEAMKANKDKENEV